MTPLSVLTTCTRLSTHDRSLSTRSPILPFNNSNSLRGQLGWRLSLLLCSPAVFVETQSVTTSRATCLALSNEESTMHFSKYATSRSWCRCECPCVTVARGWTSGLEQHQTCEVPMYISCRAQCPPDIFRRSTVLLACLSAGYRVSHVWGNNRGWCSVCVVWEAAQGNME
jgi:hypothetical protein